MPHGLVDPTVGMGCVVAGVMDDGAFQMQREKAGAKQHGQGPATCKPTPDGQSGKGIPSKKQAHGWVESLRRIHKFPRHRAVPRTHRVELLLLLTALNRPEVRQRF